MITTTTLGAFEPDKPPALQSGLSGLANAYPRASGYSPVGQFAASTDVLPAAFYGGGAFVGSDANGALFAGTSTAIYRFSAGAWSSILAGVTANSRWQFAQFGDTIVAVNGGPTQRFGLLDGTSGALTGAPSATFVTVVNNFVVYGRATGNAALVQWSGFNDETQNTPGTDQAGYQPMLDGGEIMGLVGGEVGFIIQREAIRRMTYAPTTTDDITTPFTFEKIVDGLGCIASGSITNVGQRIFFLSDRGFMMFDGANEPVPIGTERIDATFFKMHGRQQLGAMYAACDPRATTVGWLVPGSPGRLWIYNWSLDKWSTIEIGAAAVLSGFTTNVGLESLNALYPGGLESIPFSLDDVRFSGGDPLLLVVDIQNRFGALAGPNMAARFTCSLVEPNPSRVTRLRAVRPDTDAISGVTAMVDARRRLGNQPEQISYTQLRPSGDMPCRSTGRYIATTLEFADGASWTYMLGFDLIGEQAGLR